VLLKKEDSPKRILTWENNRMVNLFEEVNRTVLQYLLGFSWNKKTENRKAQHINGMHKTEKADHSKVK